MSPFFAIAKSRNRDRLFVRLFVEALENRTLLASPLPTASVAVNFAVGRMVADPVRDVVYVADQTDDRVFAVNTDTGKAGASQALASEPAGLAVSVDDNYLYVAEPEAFAIQVLSLPKLTPINTINVGLAVDNLVATVHDHLFVSTPGQFGQNAIDELDAKTGAVLGSIPSEFGVVGGFAFPLLRANPSGTELYVPEDDGSVDEYDVSGSGKPTKIDNYPTPFGENSHDILVNASAGRVYTMDGSVYGIGVTNMNTKKTTVWSWVSAGGAYGEAVAALPSGPVYGASDDTVFEFSPSGTIEHKYLVPGYNYTVIPESLKITPNGHLLYASSAGASSDQLTILGVSSLVIGNDPVTSPMPTATADVNFTIGSMVADPVRDLVYVADQTDARIFAVNTDSGSEGAVQSLAAEPGALAVSVAGDYLYVAEPAAFQIQVLSLPDLTPVNTLKVGIEVDDLIATVNDHLFVGTPTDSLGITIDEIDPVSGAMLGTLATRYGAPLLRMNSTGTHLYLQDGGGGDSVAEYDVSGTGQPTKINTYSTQTKSYSQDFVVNESAGRVYTVDSLSEGVDVTDINANATTVWSLNDSASGGGKAIAALPSGPIYAAVGDFVYEFNADGLVLAQYQAAVMAASLQITPNGHLLFGKVTGNNTSHFGIIGVSSLVIGNDPVSSPLPATTADVNFTIGRMVADPVRDLVYVADQTDARLFAVNTDSGTEVASQALTGLPGALAVSVDDNYLYVAEPDAFAIQVLSLPGLIPISTLNVGFEVDNLIATVNDHLFVSTPGTNEAIVDEVDAQTGALLDTLPTQYASPLFQTNPTGTTLYVKNEGNGSVDAYDVSGTGEPTLTNIYPAGNSQDFLVDESAGRIYTSDGGTSGVGVTDMSTGATTSWSITQGYGGGPAIAALPSNPIYVASGNSIYEFDAGGIVLAQYAVPDGVAAASLKITGNGNLLFGNVTGNNTSELGIIGVSSLVIANDPVANLSPLPVATAKVNFTIGRMVADPARDLVYVADLSGARVFAVNTDSGTEVASQALAGVPGALAVSVDDNYLYVVEPGTFAIRVLSLPDLTPVKTLNVGFEVDNLVATANDDLFVSIPGESSSSIDEVDAQTGSILGTLPTQYSSPLLRTNPTGTNLYIRNDAEISGGDDNVDEYNVSGTGLPTLTNTYAAQIEEGPGDFLVDESAARVYTLDSAGYFGVTDMDTNATTAWSFNGTTYNGGSALAALPSGPIYAASGSSIYEFATGGTVLAQYAASAAAVTAESLKITPNGKLLYGGITDNFFTDELGIIGVSSLVIANDPGTSQNLLPATNTHVNFTIGRMVADPVRDLVYVADQTDARLFAVNTDSGTEVASQALTGLPGALAVSVDDNYLYVAEPDAFAIQVLSLPDLTPVSTLNVGFEVDNLVATVNDDLFVSTPGTNEAKVDEVDAQTGALLDTLPTQYASPLFQTNPTGTNLYIKNEGGNGSVDAYDVSGTGEPTLTNNYPAGNSQDFLVDESAGRIYTSDGGAKGVGVTDMSTGATTTWSIVGGYGGGPAIAALPSNPICVASGNSIYEFDAGGLALAQYAAPNGVAADSLKITPNGNLLYGKDLGDGASELGIIGLSSLVIGNDPDADTLPSATVDVNFAIGRMVADPVRDLVYVADQSDGRILAVNTDLGRIAASEALTHSPGALAVSVDAGRLYVAEPGALQIQVLSLPDLVPVMTLHVGMEVDNLVATVNDDLLVSAPVNSGENVIDEIDAQTGTVLGILPKQYESPFLQTNPSGTHLYVRNDVFQGDGSVDDYDVSGTGKPTLANTYAAPGEENPQDFLVDESAGRAFTLNYPGPGIGVTDLNTNAVTSWKFGATSFGGQALAALPSGPLYGASGDSIYEFGAGGQILTQYMDPDGVTAGALKITANGNLLYANVTGSNTSQLGIVGLSSLAIGEIPVANFTYTTGSHGQVSFNATTSVPGTAMLHEKIIHFAWSFGDGTTGTGVEVTHRFNGPGPFTVTLTVSNSNGQIGTLAVPILGGSISGSLYNDINANGAHDKGEPGLNGWTVYLDANDNGQLDPGEVSTLTAANGSYTFTGLKEGVTYHVRVLAPPGWLATTPAEIDVPISSSKTVSGQNFNYAVLPEISGTVYRGNIAGGHPLAGWLVYLYATKNGKIIPSEGAYTITAADGSYAFTALTPGVTYQISIVPPIGWVATAPTKLDVTAVADTDKTANDFAFAKTASGSDDSNDEFNMAGQ